MSTALDIIKGSLRLIGVVDADEAPTSSESEAALLAMQQMIESWSSDNIMIPYITNESFSLVIGTASYTVGTGGDFNTDRPQSILDAYIRTSAGGDLGLEIIGEKEYNRINSKGYSGQPTRLYYVPEYPLGKIYLDAAPSDATDIYIDSLKPLSSPTALTTSISFPPGYDRALRFNLAVDLAPEYGTSVRQEVVFAADSALENLKTKNLRVPELSTSEPRRAYNILTD